MLMCLLILLKPLILVINVRYGTTLELTLTVSIILLKTLTGILLKAVNTSCIQLTNISYEFMNQCIPSKEVTMRPNDRPGYDSEIRKHTRHRDRL